MRTPNGTILDNTMAYPLFCRLYDDLREEPTKIALKVFNLLDEEQFNVELIGGDEFSFSENYFGSLPDYAYKYLRKYIPKKYGLRYVYDRLPL